MLVFLIAVLSLSMHGLPDSLTRRLEKRLQLPGITVTLAKIKLGVFEGVIATGVCCYLQGDIGAPLLTAERIVLQPRLFHRQPGAFGLRRVIIKNARANLPLGDLADDRQPIILENAQAQVAFDTPHILQVEDFSATLAGIMLTGKGRITLPERRPDPRSLPNANRAFRRGLQYYRRLRFTRPPRLAAEFDWRPAEPDRSLLHLRLETQDIGFDQHRAEGLVCDVRLAGSTLNGALNVRQGVFWGIPAEQFSGRFEINELEVRLQKLEAFVGADNQRGPFNLDLRYDLRRDAFTGRVQTWFNPAVVLPALRQAGITAAVDTINDFTFNRTPPHINADLSGSLTNRPRLALNGVIQANNLAYEGVPVELAQSAFTAEFSAAAANLSLEPLVATRREGAMQGRLDLDFAGGLLEFDAISTADPQAAARMIHPVIEDILAAFSFKGATKTRAAGQIGFVGADRDAVELAMECQRAGWGFLQPDYCNLSLSIMEDEVEIGEIAGGIFNGTFNGAAYFMPGAAPSLPYIFAAVVDAADINFNTLMRERLGKDADPYEGRLSLQMRLAGPVDSNTLARIAGTGRLRIVKGRIFQIPLFGGLSDQLGKIIPGLSMVMRQTDARARFVIHDGKISANEILIEGDILSLRANGDYHLDGRLDFKVQITLLRQHTLLGSLVRIATMPVSKILEFELTGTLAEPRWRLAYMPRDIFSIFGGGNDRNK